MADIFTKEKRSQVMQRVKPKGNKSTEIKMIAYFKENHIIGWRRHYDVIGHPDFVFLKQRIALFVDGCFWHGHDCKARPLSNTDFWEGKRLYNSEHDKMITSLFQQRGWTVIRVWECELKKKNRSILEAKLAPIIQCMTDKSTDNTEEV